MREELGKHVRAHARPSAGPSAPWLRCHSEFGILHFLYHRTLFPSEYCTGYRIHRSGLRIPLCTPQCILYPMNDLHNAM